MVGGKRYIPVWVPVALKDERLLPAGSLPSELTRQQPDARVADFIRQAGKADKLACCTASGSRRVRPGKALPGDALTPILRAVPNVKDFGYVLMEPVHDNVGRGNQLAGAFALPRPADGRKALKLGYAVEDGLGHDTGDFGVVLANMTYDGFKLVCRFSRPANRRHELSSRSIRFTTSSCSITSPRSAAAIPRSTASRNCVR